MQDTPWTITGAEWLVDSWEGSRIKEKLAYCRSFECAEAAYRAAVATYPYEHITLRQRARIVREHVGQWRPETQKGPRHPEG